MLQKQMTSKGKKNITRENSRQPEIDGAPGVVTMEVVSTDPIGIWKHLF